MADIPLHLEQLRGKIKESLFQKALDRTHRFNIITAHLNVIPNKTKFAGTPDEIGAQQTAAAYTAPLSSLEYSLYSDSPTLTRMAWGNIGQNDLNIMAQGSLQKTWATDTARNKNVIFAWDDAAIKNISFRGIKGPNLIGSQASPIVPVKALARHFFPDLNSLVEDSRIQQLSKAVMTAGPEELESSSSMRHLRSAFAMFEKPILKMNTAEQIEAVRNAIFMKAEAEGRIPELKQMLYYKGVKNLEGINLLAYNQDDRFGVARAFEKAIKPGSLGGYYTDAHLGTDINPFIKKVEHFYGEEYAQNQLRPFLAEVFGHKGSKDVGVLLGEEGELFIGKSGLHRSFVPLPAQVIGNQSTAAGLQPGRLWFKNWRNSRAYVTAAKDGQFKAIPAVEHLLSAFKHKLFVPGAGLQPGTEETAFTTARNAASRAIENIVTTVQERGEPALLQTRATYYSAYDPHTFASVNDALQKLFGAVGSHGDVRGLSEAYKKASRDLQAAGGVDPGLFYAAKAKEGIVGLKDLSKFILPGTSGENEYIKGIGYQHRPLEIHDPRSIEYLKDTTNYFTEKAGILSSSAGSAGMTEGEFEALVATEKEYKSPVGKALGVEGRQVISKYSMPVAFLGGYSKLEERTLFGDPGVELTSIGGLLYRNIQRPIAAFKIQMSRGQLYDTLSAFAGGDLSQHPQLQEAFESITSGKRWMSSEGIRIDKEGYLAARKRVEDIFGKVLPRNFSKITLMNVSEFDSMVTLGFASEGSPGSVSTLLANRRITMAHGADRFPELDKIVGGVSGMETLSGLNRGEVLFEHYANLSEYLPGKQQQFYEAFQAEAKKRGLPENLIRLGKTESGEFKIISESLKHKDNLDYIKQFQIAGRAALLKGGIPRGVIQGQAKAWAKFTNESTNFLSDTDRVFLLDTKHRIAETSEIMNQEHAFRVRLDMMRRWARGLEETTGIKPKDNPMFMSLTNWFQKNTGIKFSQDFLSGEATGVNNIYTQLPTNLVGFSSIAKGESAVKSMGLPILSEKEALDLFVNGPHGLSLSQETTTGEYLTSSLKNSALFNPKVRPDAYKKGAFVKLNSPSRVPLRAKARGVGKALDNAEYLFIPGLDVKPNRNLFGVNLSIEDSITQTLGKDSIERTLLGALSSLNNSPGSKGTVKKTREDWISDYYRSVAGITSKDGLLYRKALTAKRTPGSITGRITQDFRDSRYLRDIGKAKLSESDFTIGLSEKDLKEAIFGMKFSTKKKQQIYEETLERIKAGEQYGLTHPYPVHTAQQLTAVKVKLAKNVQDAGRMAEHRVMMSPFAMFLHHRDTDKDSIQAFIETMVLNKQSDHKANKKLIDAQIERYQDLFEEFKTGLKDSVKEGKSIKDFINDVKTSRLDYKNLLSKMLGFGQTPPLAYIGHYSLTGFGEALSYTKKAPDEVASALNKLFPHQYHLNGQFSGEAISKTREAIAKAGGKSINVLSRRADLYYGNIMQGFIQKGGKYYEDLIEFLASTTQDISKNVSSGGTIESSIELAQKATEKAFRQLASGQKLQLAGSILSEAKKRGVDPISLAAQQAGAFIGGVEHFKAQSLSPVGLQALGSSGGDVYRMATKARAGEGTAQLGGSLENLTRFVHGEGLEGVVQGPLSGGMNGATQKIVAELNEETKAAAKGGSEVLGKAASWTKNNWKIVGAGVAGLIGLRAISELTSSDELKRPPLKNAKALAMQQQQAPLPPEPMVSQPRDEVNINVTPQRAYIQKPNGRFSFNKFEGSYSSVNSNDLAVSLNSMPITPDYGAFEIRDSRSYQSNWEMQQIASRYNDSDFLNPWGYS